jgi:hypothetical protein
MARAQLNGIDVVSGLVCMPLVGAWTADVVVPAAAAITGKCTLAIDGGLTLVGAAYRTGVFEDTVSLRIAPGADGLRKNAKPKHYRNVSLSVVLRDLLATGGEALASSADAGLLATQFTAYTQLQQSVGVSISALLRDRRLQAPSWRALLDGTIWAGYETWADAGLRAPVDYQEMNNLPQRGLAELGFEAPRLLPGQALEGRHVNYLEHRFDASAVRTLALFET